MPGGAVGSRRLRSLSELEGCVLGHLWKHGPCTAYAVRRQFLDSPSSHWSGSAGAIYPLLARLEERGLVTSKRLPRGGRRGWTYALAPAGRTQFLRWLAPPVTADMVSLSVDPLRTRVYFLGALPARRREVFLTESIGKLRAHLADLASVSREDEFDRLAVEGATRMMKARLAWMEELRRALAGGKAPQRRRGARAARGKRRGG